MPFADGQGARIFYEDQGAGAPVLLVPGLGGSTKQLAQVSAALAHGHRVITVDPRGGGQSDKPDVVYDGATLATDMAGVLQACGIDAAHFVGISFGGMIGQELALRFPARVKSLCLVSSYAASDAWTDQMWRARKTVLQGQGLAAHFDLALMFLFSPDAFHRQADLVARMRDGFAKTPPNPIGYARQLDYCASHDARARLKEIKAPTLVLNGDEDILASPRLGRALADLIPGARYETVPQAAHLFMLSEPEAFAQRVEKYIKNI
jgi:pimeloyl-ACP methyl ester carboxylesterase